MYLLSAETLQSVHLLIDNFMLLSKKTRRVPNIAQLPSVTKLRFFQQIISQKKLHSNINRISML